MASASSTSIPRYRTVLSIFVWPRRSWTARKFPVIPARAFTLSIMYVPPGQGNAAHTHEVEEIFFVLQGYLTVFVEDESGRRISERLGPWECLACPPGVIHGYQNESLEPVYFQVMLGTAKPQTMGYADDELYRRRDAHLISV